MPGMRCLPLSGSHKVEGSTPFRLHMRFTPIPLHRIHRPFRCRVRFPLFARTASCTSPTWVSRDGSLLCCLGFTNS